MSVQRGVIADYAKLYGRLGIFEATYRGDVYVIDAITNNPGANARAVALTSPCVRKPATSPMLATAVRPNAPTSSARRRL